MKIIKKEDMTTSKWSGGTTTQIMIYPENGDYGKRDFIWRLSSARVELEKSDFTPLPGVDRILMVIEGTLKVNHQGHHSRVLAPYDVDEFSGGWATTSEGKVTDFNLMMRENACGYVDKFIIASGEESRVTLPEAEDAAGATWLFYYCPEADLDISNGMEQAKMNRGDLLLLTGLGDAVGLVLVNSNDANATIIFGRITLGKGGQSCFK